MRIALVNDLKVALAALARVVATIPGASIAWTAEDGEEAIELCRADVPDLVLMDMIMPVMDGVEATRRIMQECPCPIVVVTATVSGNAALVYEALGHGAMDAVNTPVLGTGGDMSGAEELVRKIRAVELLSRPAPSGAGRAGPAPARRAAPPGSPLPALVAVGASTGGPAALVTALTALPRPLSASVIVVQHVDPSFAPGFAEWLATETGLAVLVAEEGHRPDEGTVAVACTGDHLIVDADGRFRYVREPVDEPYRPSVDVFFESLLTAPCAAGTAVLLTGMGRDGAAGLLALRAAGWHTIAQDKATSVVWGMPGAAVELNAAIETLAIERIGPAIGCRLARVESQNGSGAP